MADLKLGEDEMRDMTASAEFAVFSKFPLIGMVARTDSVDALRDIPGVRHEHTVPEEYALFYLRLIKGLHWLIDDEPKKAEAHVASMSLQPLAPYPFDPLEAVNVATRIVSERGKTVVVAAGNFGHRGNGSMNPWALAPWVISVGAADEAGKELWSGSSRGIQGDAQNHPTIVAWGIDVVGPRPPSVPVDPRMENPDYTRETGTSYATAHVSGIVATIHEFIREGVAKATNLPEWQAAAASHFGLVVRPVRADPVIVKRMLIDMAVPVPTRGVHEVGAGFVSDEIAQAYYRNFRLSQFLTVFCDQPLQAAAKET